MNPSITSGAWAGLVGKGRKTEKGLPADQREAFLAREKVKTGFHRIQSVNKRVTRFSQLSNRYRQPCVKVSGKRRGGTNSEPWDGWEVEAES